MKTPAIFIISLLLAVFGFASPARAAAPTATTLNASNITADGATLLALVNPRSATTRVYFQWGLTTNFGNYTATQNIGNGSSTLLVQTPLAGLAPLTSYHFRVVASNSSGIVTGTNATFTTRGTPPVVGSSGLSVLSSTSAKFYSGMNADGTPYTAFWQWGLTTSYGNTTPSQVFSNAAFGAVDANAAVTGLTPSTLYHFRGVASNQWGVSYGFDASFTTEPPVIATTLEDTNIGPFSATLTGSAYSLPGVSSSYYFQYGLNVQDSQTPTQSLSGTGAVFVTSTITNLIDSRLYYCRLVVVTNGVAVLGNQGDFITGSMPADLQILRATNLTETAAKLKGIVTPNSINGSSTDFVYQYGPTTNYGQLTLNQTGPPNNGFSSTLLETPATGLLPGTVYHFRMRFRRINTGEIFYSADEIFSTLHIPTATIQLGTIASNLVTLNCLVNPNGLPTSVHFEWGTTDTYGNTTSTQALAAGSAAVPVSQSIGVLPVGQYHFRAVMISQDGVAVTANQIFTITNPEVFILSGCSDIELRRAIITNSVVRFGADCVVHLTNTLEIFSDVTIDAAGHSVVLSGGSSNRLFHVLPGASLNLIGLTVANGRVVGTNGLRYLPNILIYEAGESVQAGGILVTNASLTARDCTFTNCQLQGGQGAPVAAGDSFSPRGGIGGAARGGVVAAHQSSITLSNCLFVANAARAGFAGASSFYINFPSVPGEGTGGAVQAIGGSVSITNCQFRSNFASRNGGGFFGSNAVSSITQTDFATNSTHYNGGAVGVEAGTISLQTCAFQGNAGSGPYVTGRFLSGDHGGGALRMDSGFATMDDCDFAGNQVVAANGYSTIRGPVQGTPGYGGALAQLGGTSVISRTTFRANGALGGASASSSGAQPAVGGAILAHGKMNLLNCTLVQNYVRPGINNGNGTSALGSGGGIHSEALLTISSCTIASNRASDFAASQSQGGGVYAGGGSIELRNTILAGNSVNSVASSNWFGTTPVDLGHNLSSDSTPVWNSGTSLNNTDARLLPLANNGGPTLTMALRTGSPALNAADPGAFPATDQRGFARPSGSGPDIGAYEGPGTPTLQIVRVNSSTNALRWMADAGQTYRLEAATVLNAWSPFATNVVPVSGPTEVRMPVTPLVRYFRLLAE